MLRIKSVSASESSFVMPASYNLLLLTLNCEVTFLKMMPELLMPPGKALAYPDRINHENIRTVYHPIFWSCNT